jgi:hypothetical protein
VAFLAYALSVTLKQRLQALAPGLTPRAVLEKLATLQMLDVCLPTTDGRWLIMPRYTQPEPDQALMLHQFKLSLPCPTPTSHQGPGGTRTDRAAHTENVVPTFENPSLKTHHLPLSYSLTGESWAKNKPLTARLPPQLRKLG